MQFKLISLLLASTTITQIAAGPVPIAFQAEWTHLQERDEQATQAQDAVQQQQAAAVQATTQSQNAADVQDAQAVKQDAQTQAEQASTQQQQVQNAAQDKNVQNAAQAQNAAQDANTAQDKDWDISASVGYGGLTASGGVSYPQGWGWGGYANWGCPSCCATCCNGCAPVNKCGGLISGLLCGLGLRKE